MKWFVCGCGGVKKKKNTKMCRGRAQKIEDRPPSTYSLRTFHRITPRPLSCHALQSAPLYMHLWVQDVVLPFVFFF